tara:strand:+ start:405 stop:902 length:498 start_codon:yes stop_codon:yes gene_type:complete
MKNKLYLKDLDCDAKYFLSAFLITMAIGIAIGLFYVYTTTNMSSIGIVEQFNGSELKNSSEIPEKFPKPLENMILTTHDHILSFAMISLLIGAVFYFNSVITGKLKTILLIEPFISSVLMFISMWIMKYLNSSFVILMIISAIATYLCWYIMMTISLYELLRKKS